MSITNALEGGFLRRLRAAFNNHHPVSRSLMVAAYDIDQADQLRMLEGAMRHGAVKMRETLLLMMANTEAPLLDCARAATAFLHGVTTGYWPGAPRDIKSACGLVAAAFGEEEEPMPVQKKGQDASPKENAAPRPTDREKQSARDKRDRQLEILFACSKMERALKTGTDEEKLSAVQKWFAAMEYLGAYDLFPEAKRPEVLLAELYQAGASK